jgi:MFS family permease
VGPAIGGLVIRVFDVATCFYLNAASFLALITALLVMHTRDLHIASRPPRQSSLRQLAEGFRYARSTPEVVVILIVMGTIGAFGLNFMTLLPLVTKYVLGSGASTLALLTTTMGIGSVVAGLVAAYRGKPSQRLLLGAAGIFVVLLLAVGLSGRLAVTAALVFLIGIVAVLFMTSANTRLQLGVPDHLRGRVMGIYVLLFIGTTPIGSYLIGLLAEHLPFSTSEQRVKVTVLCMAGLCAIGVAAGAVYARRAGGREETENGEATE